MTVAWRKWVQPEARALAPRMVADERRRSLARFAFRLALLTASAGSTLGSAKWARYERWLGLEMWWRASVILAMKPVVPREIESSGVVLRESR